MWDIQYIVYLGIWLVRYRNQGKIRFENRLDNVICNNNNCIRKENNVVDT